MSSDSPINSGMISPSSNWFGILFWFIMLKWLIQILLSHGKHFPSTRVSKVSQVLGIDQFFLAGESCKFVGRELSYHQCVYINSLTFPSCCYQSSWSIFGGLDIHCLSSVKKAICIRYHVYLEIRVYVHQLAIRHLPSNAFQIGYLVTLRTLPYVYLTFLPGVFMTLFG